MVQVLSCFLIVFIIAPYGRIKSQKRMPLWYSTVVKRIEQTRVAAVASGH